MSTTMQDTIEREITVKATQERVYGAIADPKQIVAWFPDAVEGTMAAGEQSIFDFGEYGKSPVYIEAANPYEYFAYRWVPGSVKFTGDVLTVANTLVEFKIQSVDGGTKVTVKESGFASLPAEASQKQFEENSGGWEYMMGRLETLLNQE